MTEEPPEAGLPVEPDHAPDSTPVSDVHGSRGSHGSTSDEHLADSLALESPAEVDDGAPGADGPTQPAPARGRRRAENRTREADDGAVAGDAVTADTVAADETPTRRGWRRSGKKRAKAPWWELPLLIVIAVLVAMLIKTFVVQPYYIPSESMEQTLHGCPGCSGDRILVNKPIYHLRDPHQGDIIVFKAPSGWDPEVPPSSPSNPILKAFHWAGQLVGLVPPSENDLVKRVIAVGGQTIKCCDAQGNIQISDNGPNGPWHSLNEPYVYQNLPFTPGNDQRSFSAVTIPKGRLWVMGDHRSVSADSRYHYVTQKFSIQDSTVPQSAVIGKAVLIVWPPSRWRTLGTPSTFKQFALGVGGTGTPLLAGTALVFPVWLRRRKRR